MRWLSTGRFKIIGFAVLLGLVGSLPASAAEPLVERISFTPRADGQGLVVRVHLNGPVQAYREPLLSRDGVEMILFNTRLGRTFRQDLPPAPVARYAAEPQSEHLLLRFQIDPRTPVEATAYRDRASADLLISLTFSERPVAAQPGDAPPVRPVAQTSRPAEATEAGGAAAAQEEVGTAAARWRLDTVVIDAGHGGKDHGAIANGVREKDVTLAVARKLGRYLEDQLGLDVVYTREDDRFIELKERGHIANQAEGKLFISIHANAARSRAAQGTETYFLGMHKNEAAQSVMERENSVIQYESDPDQYRDYDEQKLILQTLAQSAYMRKSEELAGEIEGQFADRVGRRSRGVKQAGFYVLWSASMPAILVELGFLTNPREAAFLRSDAGQTYLASAIFRAVRDFKQQYEKELNLVSED